MSSYINKAIYTDKFYDVTENCYLGNTINALDSYQIVISSTVVDIDPSIEEIQSDYIIEDKDIERNYIYETVTEGGTSKTYIKGVKLNCSIEGNIKSLKVGSIGVYAYTSSLGESSKKLIVIYSSNQTELKPEDIGYELSVELSFNMKAQNIDSNKFPEILIKGSDRAKKEEAKYIISNFEDVSDNLEICIGYNSTELARNTEITQCQRILDNTANLRDFLAIYKYMQLTKNITMANCKDAFYLINKTQLHYYVKDIVSYFNQNNTGNLYITNNSSGSSKLSELLFSSSNDNITFNSACTLSMYIKFSDITNSRLIVKKYDSNNSVEYLRIYTSTLDSSNKLMIKIYTSGGYILGETILTLENLYSLENSYNSLVITFNGNPTFPEIKVYLNNSNLGVTTTSTTGPTDTIPDISSYSLRNYDNELNTNTATNYGYFISNILFFNSILSSADRSFLSLLDAKTIF